MAITMKYQQKRLNHKKVDTYRVTYNEIYKDFLMSSDYIYEDKVMFVYKDGTEIVNKIIPIKDVMQHATIRQFFKYDEELASRKFKGSVYDINPSFVFNY